MPSSQPIDLSHGTGPAARVHSLVDWCALKLKWALAWLAGFSAIGSTISGIWLSSTWPEDNEINGPTIWKIILVGGTAGFSLICTGLLDASRRGQAKGQVAARARAEQTLREAVLPSLHAMVKLIAGETSRRPVHLAKLVSDVLKAAPVVFGSNDGIRMVIYRIERFEGQRILEPIDHVGRVVDEPSAFEEARSGRGKKVFEWLSQKRPTTRFVPDTDKETDPAWAGSGRGYKTYISAPIVAGGYPLGMLTVDAPKPGDLDDTHIPMVEVLARVLAAAFVLGAD